eukprot:CAMPEP_0168833582 /NCGR_PEP_ID=MMETSP0727-20121128/3144_1 /TAXON_ID=265536 /ORGANISM="Amphiprora sp., Strain CCMP467" /LENGTH=431 /DNA_ID=CAMNT_0008886895 /DNA_START=234 /DNA_END=1527 /DNA_ORIENTATION=-
MATRNKEFSSSSSSSSSSSRQLSGKKKTTPATTAPIPIPEPEEEVTIGDSQEICIANNLGSTLMLIGVGNNKGQTGIITILQTEQEIVVSDEWRQIYSDGSSENVLADEGREACMELGGEIYAVFQTTSSDYNIETGLNFVILTHTDGGQTDLHIVQGGYSDAQLNQLGAGTSDSNTYECIVPAVFEVTSSALFYNFKDGEYPSFPHNDDVLFYNHCTPTDVPEGKYFDYSYVDIDIPRYIIREASFDDYTLEWNLVGVGGSLDTAFSTSWTKGSSSATTNANSFSFGLKSTTKVGFKEFGVQASESITVSLQAKQTVSNTLSRSFSKAETVSTTCKSPECSNGRLYQWSASATRGIEQESVEDCYFVCVDRHLNEGPKCPLGYCGNANCQCCNAQWWETDDSSLDALLLSHGCGASACTASGRPCTEGIE